MRKRPSKGLRARLPFLMGLTSTARASAVLSAAISCPRFTRSRPAPKMPGKPFFVSSTLLPFATSRQNMQLMPIILAFLPSPYVITNHICGCSQPSKQLGFGQHDQVIRGQPTRHQTDGKMSDGTRPAIHVPLRRSGRPASRCVCRVRCRSVRSGAPALVLSVTSSPKGGGGRAPAILRSELWGSFGWWRAPSGSFARS